VLRKRIGFRTVELVMQPLPQAVQELFGNKVCVCVCVCVLAVSVRARRKAAREHSSTWTPCAHLHAGG
jgi:hypothetical protein